MTEFDEKYYVNVKEVMGNDLPYPKCHLPRPKLKGFIEDGQFIQIITVEVEH